MHLKTMATKNQYQNIVPFIMFVLALMLLFKLIKPMITILLSSILLAYLAYPLYKRINRKITNKSFSIVLALFFVCIIVLVPLSFLAFEIGQEGYHFYKSLSDDIPKGELLGFGCDSAESSLCLLLNQAEKFSAEHLKTLGFDKQLMLFLPIIGAKMTQLILKIPIIIAEIFLALIISYFILKDWRAILKKTEDILPMELKTKKRLISEFGSIAHTVIYAQLFVALMQGIIGTIGFFIFGMPFPILLGVLIAFAALIPNFGTSLIWIPASLYLILAGYFSHNYWMLSKGIGLFLYGLFIISTIDNILLAKIVNVKAKVNQIIVIIGVIGGAAMFGFIGIFIGPIILPLLLTFFETFKERFN